MYDAKVLLHRWGSFNNISIDTKANVPLLGKIQGYGYSPVMVALLDIGLLVAEGKIHL